MQNNSRFIFLFASKRLCEYGKGKKFLNYTSLAYLTSIEEPILSFRESSLKIGRELSRQLNIDPAVVLGV